MWIFSTDNLRRLVRRPVQSRIHKHPTHNPSRARTRRKLHSKIQLILINRIEIKANNQDPNPPATEPPVQVQNKQVPVSSLPEDILHWAGKLHIQYQELSSMDV